MSFSFSPRWFGVGLLAGIAISAVWYWVGNPFLPGESGTFAAATSSAETLESGAVSVEDQAAGSSVLVASVTVPPPGVWVAAREISAGELGNVLGAARVGGPRTDIAVPLLRATEPGKRYAVELYRDDGDGAFDLENDSVYVDFDTGSRVVAYFTTR